MAYSAWPYDHHCYIKVPDKRRMASQTSLSGNRAHMLRLRCARWRLHVTQFCVDRIDIGHVNGIDALFRVRLVLCPRKMIKRWDMFDSLMDCQTSACVCHETRTGPSTLLDELFKLLRRQRANKNSTLFQIIHLHCKYSNTLNPSASLLPFIQYRARQ